MHVHECSCVLSCACCSFHVDWLSATQLTLRYYDGLIVSGLLVSYVALQYRWKRSTTRNVAPVSHCIAHTLLLFHSGYLRTRLKKRRVALWVMAKATEAAVEGCLRACYMAPQASFQRGIVQSLVLCNHWYGSDSQNISMNSQ